MQKAGEEKAWSRDSWWIQSWERAFQGLWHHFFLPADFSLQMVFSFSNYTWHLRATQSPNLLYDSFICRKVPGLVSSNAIIWFVRVQSDVHLFLANLLLPDIGLRGCQPDRHSCRCVWSWCWADDEEFVVDRSLKVSAIVRGSLTILFSPYGLKTILFNPYGYKAAIMIKS